MHEKTVNRTYLLEMAGAMTLYTVMLVASIKLGRPMAEGPLRTAIMLAPMLGFFGMVWAIARHLKRVDEYIRQFTLENIAIAAAATAGASFTYGFMENTGFERLSMFTVWFVLCGTWGAATVVRGLMNR
jgi:hypothetical protein